ncbi:MAG: ChaN family lipoprotein [Syntrophobacteraceae bacterium]
MMQRALAVIGVLGFLAILSAGCTTMSPPQPARVEGQVRALRPEDIVDTKTAKTISFDSLMDELSRASAIYVSETHTSVEDHHIQLKIAEGLYTRNNSLALAMEMFPGQAQPALDRYSQGALSEAALLQEANWEKVWGYPFSLYRGLLSFAAEKHLKVIGINIPPEIVRKVSRGGLSSLTMEERSQLAEDIGLNDPEHRKYIQEEFENHFKGSIKEFDALYEAQTAREETMAETLARSLYSGRGKQILVIIGRGHMDYRFGVPRRTWNRTNLIYKTLMPLPFNYPDNIIDPKLADYVWLKKEAEPAERARSGAKVQELATSDGLEVRSVLPESPASKARIQKGDILQSLMVSW